MKISVKILGSAALAACAVALTAALPVQAQNSGGRVCLNVTEIKTSQAIDKRTIVFRMRNGDVWRNTLAAPCPELVGFGSGGFSQRLHNDWMCANVQQITTQTGMVCRLGEFTRQN